MTLSSRQFRLIAAFVGINLLLVVIGWVAIIAPQRSAAATASANAQLAQNQLQALNPGSSGGPVSQPKIHTACVYRLDTALPSQADQTSLLLELQHLGSVSGVKVLGVAPQPAQAMTGGYTVLPINLTLDGSYFAVTRFLRTLRTLVPKGGGCPVARGPLFAVNSVSFSGTEPNGNVPATAGIAAFYYGVTAGATAPVDPTATDTTTTTGG